MRFSGALPAILTFSAVSTAWPWPPSLETFNALKKFDGLVYKRQGSSSTAPPGSTTSNSNSGSGTATTTANPSNVNSQSASVSSNTETITSGNSISATGSGTPTTPSGSSNASLSTVFDPRLPPGGIAMITPNPIAAAAQYYKVGDWITFAWNYTSLSITPSSIDILASCTANQATYTIALNQTVQPTGEVLWDTGAYQATATLPLLTEKYTLLIYDADSSVSATPQAGYLAPFKQFTFGMYTPQAYTPLGYYQCITCSGALSATERQTMGFLFGMIAITLVSFTWFAGDFGLF